MITLPNRKQPLPSCGSALECLLVAPLPYKWNIINFPILGVEINKYCNVSTYVIAMILFMVCVTRLLNRLIGTADFSSALAQVATVVSVLMASSFVWRTLLHFTYNVVGRYYPVIIFCVDYIMVFSAFCRRKNYVEPNEVFNAEGTSQHVVAANATHPRSNYPFELGRGPFPTPEISNFRLYSGYTVSASTVNSTATSGRYVVPSLSSNSTVTSGRYVVPSTTDSSYTTSTDRPYTASTNSSYFTSTIDSEPVVRGRIPVSAKDIAKPIPNLDKTVKQTPSKGIPAQLNDEKSTGTNVDEAAKELDSTSAPERNVVAPRKATRNIVICSSHETRSGKSY